MLGWKKVHKWSESVTKHIIMKKLFSLLFDILSYLNESVFNTGETNLIGAEGANTPETLRQKDRT